MLITALPRHYYTDPAVCLNIKTLPHVLPAAPYRPRLLGSYPAALLWRKCQFTEADNQDVITGSQGGLNDIKDALNDIG